MARRTELRAWMACAAIALSFFGARPAACAEPAEVEKADGLYQRAQALATEGRHSEALPLFEESQRLDPALGTQFAIAECHEKLGREVLAYRSYVALQRRAHEAGKPKLEQRSAGRIAVLGPRVPRLRVLLDGADTDAVVTIDGAPTTVGEEHVVEGGPHVVRAIAEGRRAWESRPSAAPATTLDVRVPKLEPMTIAAPPTQRSPLGVRRTTGLVITGAGAAVVVAGGIVGGLALSKRGDAAAACEDRTRCATQEQADAWTSAASAGTVSTVLVVTGAVVLGAGLVLHLTAPKTGVPATVAALASGTPIRW